MTFLTTAVIVGIVLTVLARRLIAERECHPTRITEQRREYPFTTTRIVWRCDDS